MLAHAVKAGELIAEVVWVRWWHKSVSAGFGAHTGREIKQCRMNEGEKASGGRAQYGIIPVECLASNEGKSCDEPALPLESPAVTMGPPRLTVPAGTAASPDLNEPSGTCQRGRLFA